jgi:hypothetical protein
MFPALMPTPMTLAKLSDVKIMQKKTFDMEKINRHDPGGHERCKDSITIKEA